MSSSVYPAVTFPLSAVELPPRVSSKNRRCRQRGARALSATHLANSCVQSLNALADHFSLFFPLWGHSRPVRVTTGPFGTTFWSPSYPWKTMRAYIFFKRLSIPANVSLSHLFLLPTRILPPMLSLWSPAMLLHQTFRQKPAFSTFCLSTWPSFICPQREISLIPVSLDGARQSPFRRPLPNMPSSCFAWWSSKSSNLLNVVG